MENNMLELTALGLMVLKSVQLIVGKDTDLEPASCGTGCIVKYRGAFLLITGHIANG